MLSLFLDIDIFIIAKSLKEASARIERLYSSITRKLANGIDYIVVGTANSITICTLYPDILSLPIFVSPF